MRARLLLIAATLVAFGASLGSGFHFDDYAIFSDPLLTKVSGWTALWKLPHPLTNLTFWLNYQLGAQDPLGYHALNVLLQIAAVLVAFECLRRMVPERAALVAALLFAVHPLQAEAVDYVWGRGMVLGALLCLLSLLAWLHGRYIGAVFLFAAALLASEQVAAFPLVLLLLDRKHLWQIGTMLAMAAAVLIRGGAAAGPYVLAQGEVILRYLRLMVVPYGFTVDPDMRVPAWWLGLLAWALVVALAWFAWKRRWPWVLGGFLLLLPSSLLASPDLAADRRMYFALLAFAVAGALLLERVRTPVAAVAAVAALVLVSVTRTAVWGSDEALWREAVRRGPDKVRPKVQLARHLRAAEALELLGTARRTAPQDPRIAAETGRILLAQGQPAAALDEFAHALAADPHDAHNYNNRGVALAELGQTAAARADFERALEMDPGLSEARENLRKLTGAP